MIPTCLSPSCRLYMTGKECDDHQQADPGAKIQNEGDPDPAPYTGIV